MRRVELDRPQMCPYDTTMRNFILALFALCILVPSIPNHAEARRHRSRRHRSHLKVINEKKLYERLGGAKLISSVTDDWLRADLADARLSGRWDGLAAHPEKLAKFRRALNDELCSLADGPCPDRELLKKNSGGATLSEEQFLFFADNLVHSLQKFAVPEREKNELLARLSEVKPELVTPVDGN